MPYTEGTHYQIEGDHWVWTRYTVPGRLVNKLRYDNYEGENRRGPYKKTMRDDGDYPLYYTYERPPEPRAKFHGRVTHPKRVMMAEEMGIPFDDLPEVRRTCLHPLCINPKHHILVLPKDQNAPITLDELLRSDETPFVSPDHLRALFNNRPLPPEVYLAFQQAYVEDDD